MGRNSLHTARRATDLPREHPRCGNPRYCHIHYNHYKRTRFEQAGQRTGRKKGFCAKWRARRFGLPRSRRPSAYRKMPKLGPKNTPERRHRREFVWVRSTGWLTPAWPSDTASVVEGKQTLRLDGQARRYAASDHPASDPGRTPNSGRRPTPPVSGNAGIGLN